MTLCCPTMHSRGDCRVGLMQVLTTSNLTGAVDPAFLDRADIKAFIGLPSLQVMLNAFIGLPLL